MLDRLFRRLRRRREIRPDDPRGGLQARSYRTADPRDLVEHEGTVMGGPGGAPQEDRSPEER
jgi:hypothetical protein